MVLENGMDVKTLSTTIGHVYSATTVTLSKGHTTVVEGDWSMKSLTSLNNIQKSVLNSLLEKYDNSKTFKGSNKVRQKFYIRPENIFSDYNDDFADAARISDFENDIEYLERENLVKVENSGSVIMRVYAITEKNLMDLRYVIRLIHAQVHRCSYIRSDFYDY